MKYAIISDIHSNLQALKAVMLDIKASNCDEIICLGDVVGYGPQPAATLALAYSKVNHFVIGNHDAVICNKMSTENFSDHAQKAIEWTRERLDEKAVNLFSQLPYELSFNQFRCTHGSFVVPERFGYIFDTNEAFASFCVTSEQVLFIGHSHIPGVFVYAPEIQRSPIWCAPADFKVEKNVRYLVNVGSVGYARDKDFRACYCIYDTASNLIQFRRVPFDVDQFREEVAKAGMTDNNTFLHVIDGNDDEPLIDFSPKVEGYCTPNIPRQPIPQIQSQVQVPQYQTQPPPVVKNKKKSQILFAIALVLVIVLFASIVIFSWLGKSENTTLIPTLRPLSITELEDVENMNPQPLVLKTIVIEDNFSNATPIKNIQEKPATIIHPAQAVRNADSLKKEINPITIEPLKGFTPRKEREKTVEELEKELRILQSQNNDTSKLENILPPYRSESFTIPNFFNQVYVGDYHLTLPKNKEFSLLSATKWSIGRPSPQDKAYPFTLAFDTKNKDYITLSQSQNKTNYTLNIDAPQTMYVMVHTHPIHINWNAVNTLRISFTKEEGAQLDIFILYHMPNGEIFKSTNEPIIATTKTRSFRIPSMPKYMTSNDFKMSVYIMYEGKKFEIRDLLLTSDEPNKKP